MFNFYLLGCGNTSSTNGQKLQKKNETDEKEETSTNLSNATEIKSESEPEPPSSLENEEINYPESDEPPVIEILK